MDKRKFGKTANAFLPIQAFKQIKFAQHLKTTDNMPMAIDDAIDAAFSDSDVADAAKTKAHDTRKCTNQTCSEVAFGLTARR
jgi:hypothetical protein